MIILYILLAIAVLMLMILIHELGHYVVGKLLGFKITEFSVGFFKPLYQRRNKAGELFSIRLVPLGGYCQFYGEDGTEDEEEGDGKKDAAFKAPKANKVNETEIVIQDEQNDVETAKEDKPKGEAKDQKANPATPNPDFFTSQAPWKRILVFLAGVTFNFISAIIFSFILLVAFGYGNVYVVTDVNPFFSQTYQASEGLNLIEKGDKILKIDGEKISYVWDRTVDTMVTLKDGNTYTLTIKKQSGEIVDAVVTIQTGYSATYDEKDGRHEIDIDGVGNPMMMTGMGLTIGISSMPLSFGEALLECVDFTVGLVWMVMKTLFLLFTFQLPLSELGGTFTVISTVASTVQESFSALFIYLPLIAANLAVFNALPLPALDGGHVVFTAVEWIRGRPVKREVESIIHFVGLIALLGFVLLIDLIHFLG